MIALCLSVYFFCGFTHLSYANDLGLSWLNKKDARLSPDGQWISWLAPTDDSHWHVFSRAIHRNSESLMVEDFIADGIVEYAWDLKSQHLVLIQQMQSSQNMQQLVIVDMQTHHVKKRMDVYFCVRIAGFDALGEHVLVQVQDQQRKGQDLLAVHLTTLEFGLIFENQKEKPGLLIDSYIVDHVLPVNSVVHGLVGQNQQRTEFYYINPDQSTYQLITSVDAQSERVDFLTLINLNVNKKKSQSAYQLWFYKQRLNVLELYRADFKKGQWQTPVLVHSMSHAWNMQPVAIIQDDGQVAAWWSGEQQKYVVLQKKVITHIQALSKVESAPLRVISSDKSQRYWIVRYSALNLPPKDYLYEKHTGQVQLLFDEQSQLSGISLNMPLNLFVKNKAITMYKPPQYNGTRMPLIIMAVDSKQRLHAQWNNEFNWLAQTLSQKGYFVLVCTFEHVLNASEFLQHLLDLMHFSNERFSETGQTVLLSTGSSCDWAVSLLQHNHALLKAVVLSRIPKEGMDSNDKTWAAVKNKTLILNWSTDTPYLQDLTQLSKTLAKILPSVGSF